MNPIAFAIACIWKQDNLAMKISLYSSFYFIYVTQGNLISLKS